MFDCVDKPTLHSLEGGLNNLSPSNIADNSRPWVQGTASYLSELNCCYCIILLFAVRVVQISELLAGAGSGFLEIDARTSIVIGVLHEGLCAVVLKTTSSSGDLHPS
jgi:hypothetical protein